MNVLILVPSVSEAERIREAPSAKGEGLAWGGARAQSPIWHKPNGLH